MVATNILDDGLNVPKGRLVGLQQITGQQGPTPMAFKTSLVFDLSQGAVFAVDQITSDFGLNFTNTQDGDVATVFLKQSISGGNLITALTATGRTVLMRDDETQINTTAFGVANANSELRVHFTTIAGVAVALVSIATGVALNLGTLSYYSRARAIIEADGRTLIDMWDSALGVTPVSGGADAWLSQKQGLSVPATTLGAGPTYTASDAAFNGKPSLACGGTKGLRLTGLTAFLANGAKPYAFCVARMPVLITDAANHQLFDVGRSGTSDTFQIYTDGTVTTSDLKARVNTATVAATTAVPTAARLMDMWVDTGNVLHLGLSGVDVVTQAGAAAVNANLDTIGIGVAASSVANFGAFTLAALGFVDAALSVGARAALNALTQSQYATP